MFKKPKNVIMLLADDLGYWGLGCYGNEEIHTPNIDKLAREGAKFENFYCTSPVCSPARASILTGEMPSQHGIHDWLNNDINDKSEEIEYLDGRSSYVDEMVKSGMIAGLSGKWHLGASHKAQMNFGHWYAHKSGAGPYYSAPMYRNGKLVIEDGYVTDLITTDAMEFIEKNKNEGFYLHVGYTAPHHPWIDNHPKEFEDLYDDCEFNTAPQASIRDDSTSLTQEVQKDIRGNLVGYYAAVSAMDYNIGRIILLLKELNIYNDTLIIFTSDNGYSVGQKGFWGKGNGTFPINLFEESVKVPFIISYPEMISKSLTIQELTSAVDIRPTLLDILKLDDPYNGKIPGNSFTELIIEETNKTEDKISKDNKYIYVLDEYGPNRMIRDEKYKLTYRYPYGPNEFYNLQTDPKEEINLINDEHYTKEIAALKKEMDRYFLKYSNPEIDGAKENVVGTGQIDLAGTWSEGRKSYYVDDYTKGLDTYNYE